MNETTLLVVIALVAIMIIGNVVFSFVSERRNPLVGGFLVCEGVRLHYIERGHPGRPSMATAPCCKISLLAAS